MQPEKSEPTAPVGAEPKDVRLRLFAQMERGARLPFVRTLMVTGRFLFVDLAPNLPKTRIFSLTTRGRWQIFWSAAAVTFLLCFVTTGIWASCIGKFSGTESQVRYFLADWHNLILYAVVCPTYVGLATVLIATVIGGYWELRRLEEEVGSGELEISRVRWRVPALVLFILAVALTLTSLYISDVTNFDKVGYAYWFVDRIESSSILRLNSLGVYYFLLNFILLLVTLISLAFFMSAFAATVRVASALVHVQNDSPLIAQSMKTKLQTFVGAYLAAKLQVGAYIINFWIWEKSPLGNNGNIIITHIFLVLIGVFFLAIPRDYIQLQWHRYKLRYPSHEHEEMNVDNLIEGRAAVWATAVDQLLISSIIYIPFLSKWLSYND